MKFYKVKINNTTILITSSKYLAEDYTKRMNKVSKDKYTIETINEKIYYLEQFD